MSMRLRRVGSRLFALCGAEFEAQGGDVYIDDEMDSAIREKIRKDTEEEGFTRAHGYAACREDAAKLCAKMSEAHRSEARDGGYDLGLTSDLNSKAMAFAYAVEGIRALKATA